MTTANVIQKAFGDASTTTYPVTHGITAATPVVQVFDAATNALVVADIVITSSTVVTVTVAAPPGLNGLLLTVVG
jgi:hypothetical protein